jgi:uncharacterized protein
MGPTWPAGWCPIPCERHDLSAAQRSSLAWYGEVRLFGSFPVLVKQPSLSAVKLAVEDNGVPYEASDNPELQVKAGCFVPLRNNGILRGCIGRFAAVDPLWRTVCEVADSSARTDSRFADNPISSPEVPHLEIEVSVLSPMRQICRPLEEIKLGRDGIVILDRGRSGTFLPQVAVETGWSLEEFLGHCARDRQSRPGMGRMEQPDRSHFRKFGNHHP